MNYHPANETISQLVVKQGILSDTVTSEAASIIKETITKKKVIYG